MKRSKNSIDGFGQRGRVDSATSAWPVWLRQGYRSTNGEQTFNEGSANKGIALTVCVDKVAASGGYMMACVANKILCAPFSFIGSIGVVAQLPNFNRLLKKHDVDIELHTAGSHKRTLTMFGENTQKDRDKFIDDLDNTHRLFKNFVSEHRPSVDINSIATGEVWLGTEAITKGLVDELLTSDEYLLDKTTDTDVYKVVYATPKTLSEKIGFATEASIDRLLKRWWSRIFSRDTNLSG